MSKKTYTLEDLYKEDVIDALRKEHGELHKVVVASASQKYDPYAVPDDSLEETEETTFGVIRKPTDKELSFAMTKLPSILDAGKVIVKNCWIGGDERILNETAMLNAAAMQCVELIEVRKSKLVKL